MCGTPATATGRAVFRTTASPGPVPRCGLSKAPSMGCTPAPGQSCGRGSMPPTQPRPSSLSPGGYRNPFGIRFSPENHPLRGRLFITENGEDERSEPPSHTWRTFLQNHVADLASVDFFVVPKATFRVLYLFIILLHPRRRIVHFNVTGCPTSFWTGAIRPSRDGSSHRTIVTLPAAVACPRTSRRRREPSAAPIGYPCLTGRRIEFWPRTGAAPRAARTSIRGQSEAGHRRNMKSCFAELWAKGFRGYAVLRTPSRCSHRAGRMFQRVLKPPTRGFLEEALDAERQFSTALALGLPADVAPAPSSATCEC